MLNQFMRFVKDESGLETVEWAIVGGVIVAGAVANFVLISGDMSRGILTLDAVTSNIP